MFNANYSNKLQSSIEQAIGDLLEKSKSNTQHILERQSKIKEFKQEIKTLEADSKIIEANDSSDSLEQARSTAIQQDCQTLATSIDTITDRLSKKNTKEAIDLIEPFINNGKLLKARVHYVHELEQLLQDFEQEKQVRSTLQKVASALDLKVDSHHDDQDGVSTSVSKINEQKETSSLETKSLVESNISEPTVSIKEADPISTTTEVLSAEKTPLMDSLAETTKQAEPISDAEKLLASISDLDAKEAADLAHDLDHNFSPEMEKMDFNNLTSTPITTQAKHLDFMLQDNPDSFVLDADALSGKALQDDLDALLLEADLLEKDVDFTHVPPIKTNDSFNKPLFR